MNATGIWNDKSTTGVGIAMIIVAVGAVLTAITDGNPDTVPDWNIFVTAIVAAVGLFISGGIEKDKA